ncbi:MAG: NAD(P)H-hydrate dehydratase [Clostridia bacterium]|nr:NAD(P)H-hydrate dehydratase [Clostridia bacterium]
MLRYLTVQEMRDTEKAAFSAGVPSLLPMETAARGLEEALWERCPGGRALFVCGAGNNGADGLAAARLFHLHGGRAEALLVGSRFTEENLLQQKYLKYLGIPVTTDPESARFTGIDAAVDALFGIGLARPLEGKYPDLIEKLGAAPFVAAADVPSGMDADTGRPMETCVKADVTVTFHAPKLGLILTEHPDRVGALRVQDVGFTHDDRGIPAYEAGDYEALKIRRPKNAHKGTCGRVLVVGGDAGMCGAAAMCALGALKAGAGLVTILCEERSLPILQALVPNALCLPFTSWRDGLPAFDAAAVGCGLRMGPDKREAVLTVLEKAPRAVIDAGALDMLKDAPLKYPDRAVITPHPGEAARILDMPARAVTADPIKAAGALTDKTGAAVILKGAVSVIRDKTRSALNNVGTPALAKGGSGDALSGILAAELCAREDPFEAARVSCLRLGLAGLEGEKRYGTDGLLTKELLRCLR